MRRILWLAIGFFLASPAFAATIVTLAPKRVTMGGDGSTPALYDLSAELRKQNIGSDKATGRLLQVDLKIKASYTGATIGLLLGGVAVDSKTVEDDREMQIQLAADAEITEAPWVLGVRGDVQILELRVTVDVAGEAPIVNPTPNRPTEPTRPTTPTNPDVMGDLRTGQDVIAVSRTSGRIEPVRILRIDADGTYTVEFNGGVYPGWGRHQLAVMSGCLRNFCVGQSVRWNQWTQATDLRIIGLLPNDTVVVESRSLDQRHVADLRSLESTAPRPSPNRPPTNLNLLIHDFVYYVESPTNRVRPAQIIGLKGRSVTLHLLDNSQRFSLDADSPALARSTGCIEALCIGQTASTRSRDGQIYQVTVVGLQPGGFAVVRINSMGVTVGNWPASSLQQN